MTEKEIKLENDLVISSKQYSRKDWELLVSLLVNGEQQVENITIGQGTVIKVRLNLDRISEEEALLKATKLLKKNKIEFPIELGRFGTYRQYELAGEKIRFELLSDINLSEKVYLEIDTILSFIDEDYIYDNFGNYHQNVLILNEDGTLGVDSFRI